MMKIALTSDYFYPTTGGAEQSALELSKALSKMGHEVVVFTRPKEGVIEDERIEGVKIKRIFKDLKKYTFRNEVPFPRSADKKEKTRLIEYLDGEDFDILHSNNRDTAVFTAETGRELDLPVVTHLRDYWIKCPKRDLFKENKVCENRKNCASCMANYYNKWINIPFYYKSYKDTEYRREKISELSDFFIYNSRYVKKRIGLSPGEVVYNPIDIDRIRKGDKEEGKILFIGNITKRKGADMLHDMVKGLDVTLHVIGDGYLFSEVKGQNIRKHGRIDYDEVLEYLSTSEILIVPSLWPEPFGRVAVEGMASGNVVIVSNKGGLPEVVEDAGVVVNDQNVKDWRTEIKKIINDESLRKKLSKKGIERSKRFQPNKIAKDTLSIYEKVT